MHSLSDMIEARADRMYQSKHSMKVVLEGHSVVI